MIKCKKGHFYDGGKYGECPFCDEAATRYTGAGTDGKTGNINEVGAIECIFGDNVGKRYALRQGINRIGRSYQMDICIEADFQIVRDNHCSILYDEKKNEFILLPSADAVIYVNNAALTGRQVIGTEDVIRIGRSDFRLLRF